MLRQGAHRASRQWKALQAEAEQAKQELRGASLSLEAEVRRGEARVAEAREQVLARVPAQPQQPGSRLGSSSLPLVQLLLTTTTAATATTA